MDIQPFAVRRARLGFTLIELSITLAVLLVLLAVAIPSFTGVSAKHELRDVLTHIHGLLYLARSEAVKRNRWVTLCPSHDGDSCAEGFRWERGLIMFADADGDRNRDDGETVIKVIAGFGEKHSVATTTRRRRLRFSPLGLSMGSNATFTVCDLGSRTPPQAVILSNTGRARFSDTRADGSPLACG